MIRNQRALWVALAAILAFPGCKLFGQSDASPAVGGGTFTGSDLNGTWQMSACTAGSSGLTGADYYVSSLTLFGGSSFNYSQIWYSDSGCSPVNMRVGYFVGGSFTVGGPVSASSSLQSIQFTAEYSSIAAYTSTIATAINGAGGCVGGGWAGDGSSHSTFMTSCGFLETPNSSKTTINNIAGLSGTTLNLGASYAGIPGQFAGNTVSSTTSLVFTKQ